MALALIAVLARAALYWFPIRRWFTRWGRSPYDLARVMAGDNVMADPTHSATHAVTVDAPPESIGHGSCRWAPIEAGCIATTGSSGCSAFSTGPARTVSFRNFSTCR